MAIACTCLYSVLPPLTGGYCPSVKPPVHINIYLTTLQVSCVGFMYLVSWVFWSMESGLTEKKKKSQPCKLEAC